MTKPILFLKNFSIEGPGTMESFLLKRNIPFKVNDLYGCDPFPSVPENYGAIIVLGGPMNVYEEQKFSFLREEKCFLRSCIEKNIPILGICLGAQLLACVLGAQVEKNEISEIGWLDVELTPDGEKSPLFENIASPFPVFQWHGDTFAIPENAHWLAKSLLCANQAFSYRNKFFGVQFHLEVNAQITAEWAKQYISDVQPEEQSIALTLANNPDTKYAEDVEKAAQILYQNFFFSICGYSG